MTNRHIQVGDLVIHRAHKDPKPCIYLGIDPDPPTVRAIYPEGSKAIRVFPACVWSIRDEAVRRWRTVTDNNWSVVSSFRDCDG